MIHQPIPDCFKHCRLISCDIETTGLSVLYNTIIEIGCVEVNNGKVVKFGNKDGFTRLFSGGHSSMYLVRKVHHIKDSDRSSEKYSTFKQSAEKISEYLSNSILVTHNGNSFDIPMIQQKLTEAGFPLHDFKSIDTLQLVRKMRKKESGEEDEKRQHGRNTLGNLCREFGLVYGGEEGRNAHRGLEDAEACLDLLFYLVNNGKVEISI